LAFPVEDGVLRERLIGEVLATSLADNTKARVLLSDSAYQQAAPLRGQKARRSQSEFVALASGEGISKPRRAASKARFPRVRLAASPLAAAKRRA